MSLGLLYPVHEISFYGESARIFSERVPRPGAGRILPLYELGNFSLHIMYIFATDIIPEEKNPGGLLGGVSQQTFKGTDTGLQILYGDILKSAVEVLTTGKKVGTGETLVG